MAKSKYNEDMPKLAEMYARKGLSDSQIWNNLGLSRYTYYEYQKKYPEFYDALKRGKAPIDFEVENSLLKRANGYTYDEETIISEIIEVDGKSKRIVKEIKTTTKQVIGSVAAQIFWLCNRQPDYWKQLTRLDVTSKDKQVMSANIVLTPDEIKAINKVLDDEY